MNAPGSMSCAQPMVFITGAASGIGRALAHEFLKEGARVLAIDRSSEALTNFKECAGSLEASVETLKADVSNREAFLALLEDACGRYGTPEIFINCAGITQVGPVLELGLDAFEHIMSVNLNGVAYGTFFALAKMEEAGGGTIVNIASTAGHFPARFMAAYSTSKFAVVGFSRAVQTELSLLRSPVRLCLVSPGFVDTPGLILNRASFPWFLKWLLSSPESVAREIIRGIKRGKSQIFPDIGGRFMKRIYDIIPNDWARSFREFLANPLPGSRLKQRRQRLDPTALAALHSFPRKPEKPSDRP